MLIWAVGRGIWGLEESKHHCCLQEGQRESPGNCRPVSLTWTPGTVMEQLVLETISSHGNDRKVIRGSQREAPHGAVVPDLPGTLLG